MESSGGDDSKKNFVKHVFSFDDDSKSEILNIIQYSLIALIPVVVLNKTMAKYIPEADENKGTLEIVAEVLIQVISMFMGLLIIHRVITFVPTYSGTKYPEYNITFIVLAVLMITLSLQTKLGEKVGILFDRVTELWNGKTEKAGAKKGNVKVSQPIAGQQPQPQQQMIVNPAASLNQAAMTQSIYTDGTSIGSLPVNSGNQFGQGAGGVQSGQQQQPMGSMMESYQEPMAANAFGGSAFGGW
jgi:hypothetical protein